MTKPSPIRVAAAAIAAAMVTAGCSPELASVHITPLTEPPIAAQMSATQIRLAEGTAIAVDIVGLDDDDDKQDNIEISKTSNSGAFDFVETATNDRFVFYGTAAGGETLSISSTNLDGAVVVAVTVDPQP